MGKAIENPGLKLLVQGLKWATLLGGGFFRAYEAHILQGFSGAVVVEVTGAKGGVFTVEVNSGRLRVYPGTHPFPRSRIQIPTEDFFRSLTGEVSGMILELSGRIKHTGEPQGTWIIQGISARLKALREEKGIRGMIGRGFTDLVIHRSGVKTRFPSSPSQDQR